MRIASVCFYPHNRNVGGAQTPSVAFKQWCDIFHVDCDLVTMECVAPYDTDIPEEMHYVKSEKELCEKYDFAFFSTPGIKSMIDYDKVSIPFAMMVHGETDPDLYGREHVKSATRLSKINIVIDERCDYWDYKNQFLWHPCTLPSYLIKPEDKPPSDVEKSGLLYSARYSTWKNIDKLAILSKEYDFRKLVDNKIVVRGVANNPEFEDWVNQVHTPQWTRLDEYWNIYDFDLMKRKYEPYTYFWDVYGKESSDGKQIVKLPRLNLAAVEAIKFGLLPIVDKNTAPRHMRHLIDHRNMSDARITELYRERHDEILHDLYDEIKRDKRWGYNGVNNQIARILEGLLL